MRLPPLHDPQKYVGLYVFDFGDRVSVGYTGAEITMLFDSDKYKSGKAYRIHRVLPDGTIHLEGVSKAIFTQQDGLFFVRARAEAARADFLALVDLAAKTPPPCHLRLQLADTLGDAPAHVTAILFPAESTHDVSRWLQAVGFAGGDTVVGGPQEAADYLAGNHSVLEERQLQASGPTGRPQGEVLAATHLAV